MIKRSEVRYYGGIDPITGKADEVLPERFDRELISADCAFKDAESNDFVAIGVISTLGRKRFVRNVVNAHLDAGATEQEIRNQRQIYPRVTATLIEDKANGPAVTQRLKANVPGVIEINPQGGKVARMYAVAPEWQAGDWYVDRNAAWAEPFIQQITMFPTAANDDMVDCMTQAAIWLGSGAKPIYQNVWSDDLLYDDESEQRILSIRTPGGHRERYIGVAYGVDQPQVYLDCIDDGTTLWFDREYFWDSHATGKQKTDKQYVDDLAEFSKTASDAQTIIPLNCSSFEAALQQNGVWYCAIDEDDDKPPAVLDGIRIVANLMSGRKIRVHRYNCPNTAREIPMYSWDTKASERGVEEPVKVGAQCCNAIRFIVKTKIAAWRAALV
jgi:predicted phage terminase large subunit-like protein